MPSLKILIRATLPLPRKATDAANASLGAALLVDDLAARLREFDPPAEVETKVEAVDEETPPPAQPPGRKRRAPRSAQSEPLQAPYTPPGPSASPTAEPAERAPAGDPTIDGLGPEAGTDPGPIPPETGLLRSAAA